MQKKLTEQGLKFLESGQFNQAAQILTLIISNYPDNADAHHMLGIIELERSNFDLAYTHVQRALLLCSRNSSFYNTLGNVELHRSNYAAAEQAFLNAVWHDQNKITYKYNLAHYYLTSGQYEQAIYYYYEMLKLEPLHYMGMRGITVGYLYANQPDIALEHALLWSEQFHSNDEPYYYLGLCYYALDNYAKALKTYDKGLSLFENNYEILIGIASCYKVLGNYQIAESYLHRALSIEANNPVALNNLGWLSLEQGEFEIAAQQFNNAINLDDKFADPVCGLGVIQIQQQHLQQGLEYFTKAKKLEPHNPKAGQLAAQALLQNKNFAQGWLAYATVATIPTSFITYKPWNGNKLSATEALLIWLSPAELNFTTHLLYASMFADLATLEATVVIMTTATSINLFRRNYPELIFIEAAAMHSIVDLYPQITHHTPLHCLGQFLRLNKRDFKKHAKRYLQADVEQQVFYTTYYRNLFPGHGLVGVAWKAQDIKGVVDHSKSGHLSDWLDALCVEHVQLIALQTGAENDERIFTYTTTTNKPSFDELCAQISALDLVITVDNYIAVLAAALGTRSIVLLPEFASWYWFNDADSVLWNDKIRLMRINKHGGWQQVLEQAKKTLHEFEY